MNINKCYLYYMLFPYGDDNSDRHSTPIVTYALIVANILVFILLQKFGANDLFTYGYSTVPAEILTGKDIISDGGITIDKLTGIENHLPPLYATKIHVYLTTITSMFMHGGIGHLLGNMLYLYICGDNIENRIGKVRFIVFYLLTGIIASLSHVFSVYFSHASTLVPCLGASGAISAVMGAYLFLYPQNKIKAIFLYMPVQVPAFIALGLWIIFQIVNGLGIIGGKGDSVAYAAHIGGFIAGFLLINAFASNSTALRNRMQFEE
jgi:membrane associated rhomboid family serine protease